MSAGTTLETLLLTRSPEKLLRGVYELNPRSLLKWLKHDEKGFKKLTAKVALVAKKNRKLLTKIRGGK